MPNDHASPDEKTDNHNDGEKDAAEGNGYNPPHGWVESNLSSAAGRYQEENESYGKGWDNGKKQSD